MLMLKLMPSSLEGSPLLTTLPPLQDTLLEPSAPLPQLLPLLAQLPSAIPLLLLLLLPSATQLLLFLLLLLLHLLLLLTTSPLSASQSPGGSAGASPSRLPAPFKLPSASPCPSAPPSPDA